MNRYLLWWCWEKYTKDVWCFQDQFKIMITTGFSCKLRHTLICIIYFTAADDAVSFGTFLHTFCIQVVRNVHKNYRLTNRQLCDFLWLAQNWQTKCIILEQKYKVIFSKPFLFKLKFFVLNILDAKPDLNNRQILDLQHKRAEVYSTSIKHRYPLPPYESILLIFKSESDYRLES